MYRKYSHSRQYITGNTNGVLITHGTNIWLSGNDISGNTGTNYENQVVVSEQLPAIQAASVQYNAVQAPDADRLQYQGGDDNESARSYLQFDLDGIEGKLATAWVYVYGQALESPAGGSGADIALYAVDDNDWDSNTIIGMKDESPPELGQKLDNVQLNNNGENVGMYSMRRVCSRTLDGGGTISLAFAQDADKPVIWQQLYNGADCSYRPYLRIETYPPVELATVQVTVDRLAAGAGYDDPTAVSVYTIQDRTLRWNNAEISFIESDTRSCVRESYVVLLPHCSLGKLCCRLR